MFNENKKNMGSLGISSLLPEPLSDILPATRTKKTTISD
jgi:hypothetical protein